MRTDKRAPKKADKKAPLRVNKRGVVGYSKKSALLEEAITHMNTGKYGRSSAALKELLALDPHNTEARRLFATLHLRLGSLVTARQAFESLANEAIGRQDYWLAESLLREYLAAGSRCVPFLELLAHVYVEKGDEMAAVGELGKAIEILRDDPDSDNPRKPAELYAKIRELAPGSPVAIGLASLFDVQTGEILFRPPSDESMLSPHDTTDPLQNDVPPIASENSLPEVMPWEQSEDSNPVTDSPVASISIPIGPSEFKPATDSPAQTETRETEPVAWGQELPVAPLESTSSAQSQAASKVELAHLHEMANGSSSIAAEPSTEARELSAQCEQPMADGGPSPASRNEPVLQEETAEALNQDRSTLVTGGDHVLSSPMPWEQMADESVQILDAEPRTSPNSDSALAPIISTPVKDVQVTASLLSLGTDEEKGTDSAHPAPSIDPPSDDTSAAGLSPMPWEQVADSTLQIPEAEPSPEPSLIAAVDSILSDLRKDLENSTPSHSFETSPAQTLDPAPTDTVLGQASAAEELSASSEAPESEPPAESPEAVPRASSFSWTSVFDTAWKFAAGTTVPSTSAPSEQAEAVSNEAQGSTSNREAEKAAVDTTSLQSDASFARDSSPVAEATVLEKSSPSLDQIDEVGAETIVSEEAALVAGPPTVFNPSALVPSYPAQEESTSADFPESLAHSPSDETPKTTGSPAIPVSFSTVLDAQEIPEVDSIPVESPEQSVPIEIADPEPLPEPSPVQTKALPANEEPSQAVGGTLIAEDPPQKSSTAASPMEAPSHWSTGEVAVQLHRPTAKKKKWEKEPKEITPTPPISAPILETLSEKLSEAIREWKSTPVEEAAPSVEQEGPPPQVDTRPEWMQASAGITFRQPHATSREAWQDSSSDSFSQPQWEPTPAEAAAPPESDYASTVASSAVDVLFSSTGRSRNAETQDRLALPKPHPRLVARLHRIRIGVSSFIGSCFSTTRSLTVLALAIGVTTLVVAALGIGALGFAWMAMEYPPSPLYQRLTGPPPRAITDAKKNGYLLLLGFDAPAEQDPMQVGYERKVGEQDASAAQACMNGEGAEGSSLGASSHVVKGWFRSADPVAQLKGQGGSIKALAAREASSLARYKQWLTMPFDDWGYGQSLSPNCAQILLAHRLFILEGFSQDSATGIDRLEADTQSWRVVLGQSKTLMMKMLAVTAVQDDAAMASGLLGGSELDGNSVTRLSKLVRPLDQMEISLRWPMQSHFVWATKSVPADLKHDRAGERPWYVSLVAGMRLPIQRRANAYAEYYEEVNKAVAAGRFSHLPKRSSFVRTPAIGVMDYLANPVEHIVGIEPLPSWDPYVMRMMETDAQLRLVGLQAWIRRGPQEGDLLTRLAKAGQAYYDPFTGLPMLVNQRKGLIYSVGRDGKDQEGDHAFDVVVAVPSVPSNSPETIRTTATSQPR